MSDFAVILAIIAMIGLDLLFGVNTGKLEVPGDFKVRDTPGIHTIVV